ncbi:undecaprenyldiphospho-muramoylpentapeptide beta-N-acetylglucosaminyltransferase [Massilia sp. W12]|uniref:undecaprenyldiphospho-muramoylpentapeptide beta-N-acetylglucosaminyltransferase n=1 Tax=Massilia sp. W12 TaxID=3126507 RepID=UPI0030D190AB
MKRLLIMAAGTGGHIFPGLAIAATMQAQGWQVSWLGTTHGMENRLVPPSGIPMDVLDFSGVRGKGLLHTVGGVWRLLKSTLRARTILRERKPDVVLGMGGYVTVPGGFATRMAGLPLVLVNADAALLLSNKALLPHARKVLFGFPLEQAEADKLGAKAVVCGNPVRAEILALAPPAQRFAGRSGPLRILVVGGSLGAQVLNQTVPQALQRLPQDKRPLVTHQSGVQHIDALRAAYQAAGVQAEVLPFIDDMARRYAEADLVICRAGAITLSELSAAGVASALVPFIASTTSHQRDNADMMQRHGAALHLPQNELTPDRLAQLLLQTSREQCLQWAQAAHGLGRRQANAHIAAVLQQMTE